MYKFTYKNTVYTFNPINPIPFLKDNGEVDFGERLCDSLGMTEEEVASCHAEGLLNELKAKRNELIAETDWTSGEDVPQGIKDLFFPYRQQLRDITQHYKSLDEVVWPEKPEV